MAHQTIGQRRRQSVRGTRPTIPFRIKSWNGIDDTLPFSFVSWIFHEAGRLGIGLDEFKELSCGRFEVLMELVHWLTEHPDRGYADLHDWTQSDPKVLAQRIDYPARQVFAPIEIHAEINRKRNLTVSWYPAGWRSRARYMPGTESLDFTWFERHPRSFWGRPANELMFLRGVDITRPGNPDVHRELHMAHILDSLIICAIRAAYNRLIVQLRQSFDVTVLDDFVFDLVEYKDKASQTEPSYRVANWRIEETDALRTVSAKSP